MKNKNNNKFSVSDLSDNDCTSEWLDTFNTCISNCGGAEECPSFDFNVCWRNHCHDVHACALVKGVPKKQADKERDKCIEKMHAPDWNNPKTNAERTRPNPSNDPWGTLDPGSCSPFNRGEYCGCWIKRGGRIELDRDMSHLDCSMASESKHGFREEVIDPDGTSDTQQVTKVGQVGAGNCGCGSSAKSHRLQHEDYMDQIHKRVFAENKTRANLQEKQPKGVDPIDVTGNSCCYAIRGVCVNTKPGEQEKCEESGGEFLNKKCGGTNPCFEVAGHCTGVAGAPCMTMGDGGRAKCVRAGGTWNLGPCP